MIITTSPRIPIFNVDKLLLSDPSITELRLICLVIKNFLSGHISWVLFLKVKIGTRMANEFKVKIIVPKASAFKTLPKRSVLGFP